MNTIFDALLNSPIGQEVVRVLLFSLFALHFLFVLFTLGTALQSVYYFLRYRFQRTSSPGAPRQSFDWAKEIQHTFMVNKSMTIVIGVGALLLIEIGFAIPFFTAINLLAPYWLLVIGFLIAAFLAIELLGRNWDSRPSLRLVSSLIGLALLLAVPGIFVAVMVTAEHPETWTDMIRGGYHLNAALSLHWLFRYGHVLGAALVFGGGLHYFLAKKDQDQKRAAMLRWMMVGLIAQAVLGTSLLLTLPQPPDLITYLLVAVGVVAGLALAWMVFARRALALRSAAPVMLLVLLPMLLARQMIQSSGMLPVSDQARQNASAYTQRLSGFSQTALDAYQADLTMNYSSGEMIYSRSCTFCHGVQANGQGPEAANLIIPPEVLAAVRADESYLQQVLSGGVKGTAMPYFTFLTSAQVHELFGYLNTQYEVLGQTHPASVQASQNGYQQAQALFAQTCAQCHGGDGSGSQISSTFAPPPPDFTRYSLLPDRAFEVITNGYPGTMMVAFNTQTEETRWGLVKIVLGLRK